MMDDKEGDSPMACLRCQSQWGILDGNTLVCGKCGYRHTVPLKPSYEELLRENKKLKEEELLREDKQLKDRSWH